MRSACDEIDRLLRFLERRLRLLADRRRVDRRSDACAPAAAPRPSSTASARNAPIWNVTRCGAADAATSALQLALEHRPHVDVASGPRLDRRDVGHERPAQPRGQRRREVARLIRVREEHAGRRFGCSISAASASDVAVGACSPPSAGVVDDDHFGDGRGGSSGATRIDAGPEHGDLDRAAGLLRRGDRFPASRD